MALKIIRYCWNNLTGLLFWLVWRILFRTTVIGKKNLKLFRQQQGNTLVIANHRSLIDSWLSVFFFWPWSLLNPTLIPWHTPAKENYFAFWPLRVACLLWQCIPVERNRNAQRQLIQQLSDCLKNGVLMLFPEGGRHLGNPREMRSWKPGATQLAIGNKATVLPFAFQGMRQVLPAKKFSPRFHWLPRLFKKIVIVIGQPIPWSEMAGLDKKQVEQKMRNALQNALDIASKRYFKDPS